MINIGDELLNTLETLNKLIPNIKTQIDIDTKELERISRLQQDFVHIGENYRVAIVRTYRFFRNFGKMRKERRKIKYQLEMIEAALIFIDTINSGKLQTAISKMRKVKEHDTNWIYNLKEMTEDELNSYLK